MFPLTGVLFWYWFFEAQPYEQLSVNASKVDARVPSTTPFVGHSDGRDLHDATGHGGHAGSKRSIAGGWTKSVPTTWKPWELIVYWNCKGGTYVSFT